ncbi:MAG: hypothetical protein NZM25_05600 [Leptospiraceae bacterium]|nr:hypothetical protein [Leptospiraceae bacterium]MDW8306521.1 hypothetical protein [Leptospiraceae bacterium]
MLDRIKKIAILLCVTFGPRPCLALLTGYGAEIFWPGLRANFLEKQLLNTVNGGEILLEDQDFHTRFSVRATQHVEREVIPLFSGPIIGKALLTYTDFEFSLGLQVLLGFPQNTVFFRGSSLLQESRVCSPLELHHCPLARWGFVEETHGMATYELIVTGNEWYWGVSPILYVEWKKPWIWFSLPLYLGLSLKYYQLYNRIDFNWQLSRLEQDHGYAMVASWHSRGISGRGFALRPYVRFSRDLSFTLGIQGGLLWLRNTVWARLSAIKDEDIYAQSVTFIPPAVGLQITLWGIFAEVSYRWDL